MLCIASVIAQPTLTLNGTTSFTILAGTPVSMNGLVLTPAANFSIAAPNQLDKNPTLSHIVTDPYVARAYKWSNTLPTFQGVVGFNYADGELNSIPESALILQVHTGSLWQPFTTNVTRNTAINLINTDVSNIALNELTLTDAATLLPLQWGNITAYRQNGTAIVRWAALDAVPGDHFVVERSQTGRAGWQPVSLPLPANTNRGDRQYMVEDVSVPAERTFYRVKLINGNSYAGSLSRMVMVPAVLTETVVVYPNPVTDKLSLQSTGTGIRAVNVYNAAGKLVYSVAPGNVFFYSFNTRLLTPGYYRLQVILANAAIVWYPVVKK